MRAPGHRPLHRGLRGPADRAPAARHPAADGQGRRQRARALRRRLVQAAQLDEPAVHAHARASRSRPRPSGRHRGLDGPAQPRPTTCWWSDPRGARTTRRTSSASTPGWSRTASRPTCSGCSPSRSSCSATGHTLVRREYMTAIGPVDILARDGAGAERRRRDQAARRHRRRRAADPLPRADEPRPAAGPGASACSPRRRSSRRRGCWRGSRHPLRHPRLRCHARGRRPRIPPVLGRNPAHECRMGDTL